MTSCHHHIRELDIANLVSLEAEAAVGTGVVLLKVLFEVLQLRHLPPRGVEEEADGLLHDACIVALHPRRLRARASVEARAARRSGRSAGVGRDRRLKESNARGKAGARATTQPPQEALPSQDVAHGQSGEGWWVCVVDAAPEGCAHTHFVSHLCSVAVGRSGKRRAGAQSLCGSVG